MKFIFLFTSLPFVIGSPYQRRAVPEPWTELGCYVDGAPRTLSSAGYVDSEGMTIESCIAFCEGDDYIYAGVEYAQECFCGNTISGDPEPVDPTECGMPCTGDDTEICGDGGRINIYWNGEEPPPPPEIVPGVGDWVSLGCYTEGTGGRALANAIGVEGGMSIEKCTTACYNAGYPFAGAEYAGECFCDSVIRNDATSAPDGDCNMVCSGDSSQYCGGPNRLNVYNYTGDSLPENPNPPGNPGGPATVFPVEGTLEGNFSYGGCWVDGLNGRVLLHAVALGEENTVENCVHACVEDGYEVAGMEYGVECYCGNALINGAEPAPNGDSECNMGCAGNSTQACGAGNRLSVYSVNGTDITVLPVPTTQEEDLGGRWRYVGCMMEPPAENRLPNKIVQFTNNTAPNCLADCARYGYPVGGVEYGSECYCGDPSDVEGADFAPEEECNMPCAGDPIHVCGAGGRLSLYVWDSSDGNELYVWHDGTDGNGGRTGWYEFFVPGVITPLIATVGINNKVTFLEKHGTSFYPNSTGAYELDLSLAHNFSAAWREMHVQTDVFCAGSIILPDKAARQINVGGWSADSTFGIRFYTPDGVPGVNSTNDWEENPQVLQLQQPRWYPTVAMLPNGSILVMGGEEGSNGAPTPNLEVLPKPEGGSTVVDLEWLRRTDPNNLYPFIYVLPSGNLFVGYYNEARILDPVTFDTIQELPNMPGSVVDQWEAGRTYPLEGAATLLPQHAPYTDPLTIIMCGGSGIGANAIGLDNCVSLQPEVPEPEWVVERMPSRRVLTCIANLPDGTIFIVNGAKKGVAGFGLAEDPNYEAILYDPYQPVGKRMSTLNSTIVARMYHSEATLLPDGRVLISGSDPQDGKYPEEMRIEVYVPPYLSEGLQQPEFELPDNDWAYGGTYQITNVQLHQGGDIRVSLVAATSSTHGNTMGSRTIFPEFSCAGAACSIVAPPNTSVSPPGWHMLFILDGPTPSHAQWVRIGGDPGELGNWPQLPGFTTPGL